MNEAQLKWAKWAKLHDWYRSCLNVGTYENPVFHVYVACQEVHLDKQVTWDRRTFTDLKSLRDWAGY